MPDRSVDASVGAAEGRELVPGVVLDPGERVLWQGRPGFGVPRAERRRLFKSAGTVMGTAFVIILGYSLIGGSKWRIEAVAALAVFAVLLSVVPTVVITLSIYLAKLTQASTASLAVVIVCAPLIVLMWIAIVSDVGVVGATRALTRHPAVPCVLILAVPLVPAFSHLVRRVLAQLHTRYYLTDRRFVEVRGSKILAQGTLPTGWIQVRAIPLGDGERGHVAIGTGRRRVLLRLVDHPALVVEEIRREMDALAAERAKAPETAEDGEAADNAEGDVSGGAP